MSEGTMEALRAAVNLARANGIRTVAVLRARLHGLFPDRHADVDAALQAWANWEKSRPSA